MNLPWMPMGGLFICSTLFYNKKFIMKKSDIWGGRFQGGPEAALEAINVSIHFDRNLYAEDLEGSRAHVAMLAKAGIVSVSDAEKITKGLDQIEAEIEKGTFPFRTEYEDIHMNIEARLAELIGDVAGRLHTGRSRNDQVATDLKLWVRRVIARQDKQLQALQTALIDQAERHADLPMPGYTHLQVAQPVTFGHHLLAYVEMLGRDRGRLHDALQRMGDCPLGSAALAGTAFPINRDETAKALGFERPGENSIDGVSARDFALEYLAAASILAVHLSRFAEEIVIWMSEPFRFISLPDSLTTGSSIMPQKRNPDAAELVRAKPGRILGAFQGLSLVMKGVPLAYGKDLQEDKEPLFDAVAALDVALGAMCAMAESLTPQKENMTRALEAGFPTATDLADWLVRELGMPFRQAHHVTGKLVAAAETQSCGLEDLPLSVMQEVEPAIDKRVYSVLTIKNALDSRQSYGGTAPNRVREAVARARKRFL